LPDEKTAERKRKKSHVEKKYRHCVEKVDLQAATDLYRRILPVIERVGQHRYVSATKQALELMGLPVGPPRPPRLPASGEELVRVERTIRDLGLTYK
jgi:4-hydroxy-tetrahydrodipicolinate synthase